jgi:hypothetical protein
VLTDNSVALDMHDLQQKAATSVRKV